jgi:NAD(P)-dependent dehydrogenase (short-subunit alcohol dehydrogenase family)
VNTLFLTGSSGGLGRVVRSYFLERGWNVAGFDVIDDSFSAKGYGFYKIDSMNEALVIEAFAKAANTLGTPRTLFATIGGVRPWKMLDEVSIEDYRFIVDLNVTSTFISAKAALKLMKPLGKGTIVTMGAETALKPEPKKSIYVATKAAVIVMTQTLALETKEYGVNTNCIVPTVIHTKANEEWGAPEDFAKWTNPADIASLCLYLSGDEGAAINGSVIRIPNKL